MSVVFSRIKTWVSNEVLTAADLNAEFDNQLTHMIPSGIGGASDSVSDMQATTSPGGVGTESLASTILDELKRLRYKIKEIIGGAQWYSTPLQTLGTTTVSTLSSSSGSFTTTATTNTDVTNLTGTITATGRPVFLGLVWDGTAATPAKVSVSQASGVVSCTFTFLRGATEISVLAISISFDALGNASLQLPASSIWTIDEAPAAGSTTYKVQVSGANGETVGVANAKLKIIQL